MRFLLTTDPGIESVVADEVAELRPDAAVRVDPYGCGGQLRVELDTPAELERLATVHHILEVRHEAPAATLDEIRAAAAAVELPELRGAASFRVTTERIGRHAFSTIDVQRAAGGVLQQRFGTPVRLEDPEVEIHIDVYGVPRVRSTRASGGRGRCALRSSPRSRRRCCVSPAPIAQPAG